MLSAIILSLMIQGAVVETSFDSALPQESWIFEPIIAYGDDDDEILGKNVGSIVYKDGIYYILDTQAATVIKITAEGDFELISVAGEGPGECTKPMNMIIWPDQNHLGIFSPYPPLRLVNNLQTCNRWPDCQCPNNFEFGLECVGGHIIYNMPKGIFALNLFEHEVTNLATKQAIIFYRLSLFDDKGDRIVNVFEEQVEYDPKNFKTPLWWRDSARRCFSDDSIFLATGEDYRINRYSLDGELTLEIQQDYPRREISWEESNYFKSAGNFAPDIHSLFWQNDRLLVLTSQGSVADDLSFDAFHFGDEVKMTRVVLQDIQPSPTARYFWLDQDHLAIVYGALEASLEVSQEHFVRIFQRKDP